MIEFLQAQQPGYDPLVSELPEAPGRVPGLLVGQNGECIFGRGHPPIGLCQSG